eukprot:jgi/Tetstr1/423448/TSEL_014129.t1
MGGGGGGVARWLALEALGAAVFALGWWLRACGVREREEGGRAGGGGAPSARSRAAVYGGVALIVMGAAVSLLAAPPAALKGALFGVRVAGDASRR